MITDFRTAIYFWKAEALRVYCEQVRLRNAVCVHWHRNDLRAVEVRGVARKQVILSFNQYAIKRKHK
jgi:hypothetical protein